VFDGPAKPRGQRASFAAYLDVVRSWHGNTEPFVRFLRGDTSEIEARKYSLPLPTPTVIVTAEERGGDKMEIDSNSPAPASSTAVENEPSIPAPSSPSDEDAKPPRTGPAASESSAPGQIPLLLLPALFLATSTSWASALSMSPGYTQAEHWAWAASLWRGVQGPDFVVYVTSEIDVKGETREVEMFPGLGVVLVRCKKEEAVSEAAVRRLSFELGELVRAAAAVT